MDTVPVNMDITKKGLLHEEAIVNSGLMDDHMATGIKFTVRIPSPAGLTYYWSEAGLMLSTARINFLLHSFF